jgi:serine/threonine-protein phosphatase 6 regulatory ankyrin repeat subunit B
MKKRLGCLGIVIAVLAIGYGALWFTTRNLDDFEDDFLNAVYAGKSTTVEAMLKNGENPNKHDSYGNNPMTLAAYAGHADILALLLDHGGRLEGRDNTGMTPLHCAAYYNRIEACEVLLKNGAALNATNNYGFTPLSESVMKGYPDMVALLLSAGATVTNRDERGWQPLHQALRSNRMNAKTRTRIVTMLLDHGADLNADNPGGWQEDSNHDSTVSPFAIFQHRNPNRGNTPLAIAESNGFRDIAELLRKRGALK